MRVTKQCPRGFGARLWLALAVTSIGYSIAQASELERRQHVYSCQEQITPDQLVIAGGASAQSISPAQAGAQIDLRINNIKAFITGQKGSWVLQDRLRAARNPDQRERQPGEEFLPFLQIQRFEVILPVNSNIDQVLESLFKLGMDRYGKSVRIDEHASRSFSSLTRYRISNLKARLDTLVANCRAEKLKAICPEVNSCDETGSYATLTAKYLTEDGQRDLTLNVIGDATLGRITEPLEPSSAAAVVFEFQGSISFTRMATKQ